MTANSTSFQPGQSGNPGGRPKMALLPDGRTIAELARDNSADAMQVLISIANDSAAPAVARVSAANAVLDRGWGKPQITLGDADGDPLAWIGVIAAARDRLLFGKPS